MKIGWISLIFLLSLIFGSCAIAPGGAEEDPELPPSEPEIIPPENSTEPPLQLERTQEPTEMPPTPPVEKFAVLAKQDLASRLGVEADKITVVKSAEKLWLSAALGCPRPGVFYPAGRVPGFQIWLEVEGIEYVYNTDFNGTLILCPELNPHAPNLDTDPTPGVPIR
jgi:hypothetical protein